jgi:hypothetical protein
MICQGYWLTAQWEKSFNAGPKEISEGRVATSLRVANWSLGVTAFFAFLIGLGLLAYVSVTLVSPGDIAAVRVPNAAMPGAPRP